MAPLTPYPYCFMSFKNLFCCLSFLSLCFCSFNLKAEIIEIAHFEELKEHVTKPGTLLLVDIDDTCLIPCQTLGTDVWFIDIYNDLKKSGLSNEDALDQALAKWEAIRHLTQVKLVEPCCSEVLSSLQQEGVTLMALTTQGLALATRTQQQLASLGIHFSITAPCKGQDFYFDNGHGVLYRNGIFFTSGTPKGPGLETLLGFMDLQPSAIVFINDKLTHLRDIERSVEKMGIPFTGLRYSYSDERVKNYDKRIAQVQFERSTFSHILSDDEARAILSQE